MRIGSVAGIAALLALGVAPARAQIDLSAYIANTWVQSNSTVPAAEVAAGCAGAATGRTLVRFAVDTYNGGASDWSVGDPACATCPASPATPCGNPLFQCDAPLGQAVIPSFVRAELQDDQLQVLASTELPATCVSDADDPYCSSAHDCTNQGIGAACVDVGTTQPCRYVDVTDLALTPGSYLLQVAVDDGNVVAESDEGNNVHTTGVYVGGFDLAPEVVNVRTQVGATVPMSDVAEGCATGTSGRKLVRFNLHTKNLGPYDFELGDPSCATCPGTCGNPFFQCDAAQGVGVVPGYARAELLDDQSQVIASTVLPARCLLNEYDSDCTEQGIDLGQQDVGTGLACQYVDITDVNPPQGDYALRVTVDDGGTFVEGDESNNTTTVPVHIGPELPDLVVGWTGATVNFGVNVSAAAVADGCAAGTADRKTVSVYFTVTNNGPSDFVLGTPDCPMCPVDPQQPCGEPLYQCNENWGEPLVQSIALLELLDAQSQVVTSTHARLSCLADTYAPTPTCPAAVHECPLTPGVSPGCESEPELRCSTFDVTDLPVPEGDYTVRVTLDDANVIPEADEGNNVTTFPVHIGPPPPPTAPPLTCPVIASTDVPKTIADLATASSTLAVTTPGTVRRVRIVNLNGAHPAPGQLRFHLRSPQATDVTVIDQQCGTAPNFWIDLTDEAAMGIQCPLSSGGAYQPSNPLATFDGETAAGTWTLDVEDLTAGGTGRLDAWGIELCTSCGDGVLDAGEVCDDGNTADADCCSSDCQTPATDGTSCDDSKQCILAGECQAGTCTGGTTGCNPCLACSPGEGCVPPTGLPCDGAALPYGSTMKLDVKRALDSDPLGYFKRGVKFEWKTYTGVSIADFGDPRTSTDFSFCVYDLYGLRLSAEIPAGGECGLLRPCWKASSTLTSFSYSDRFATPDGITKVGLKASASGRATVAVQGKGENLSLTALPYRGVVKARVIRHDAPLCWQGTFPSPRTNSTTRYKSTLKVIP